jgi:cytochrome c-type biogenesis protein CcmH
MMLWAALAAVLTALVLWVLLRPLRRPGALTAPEGEAANIAIARARLAELDGDRAAGSIGEAQYAEARADLEQELARDLGGDTPLSAATPGGSVPVLGLAIALPLAALLIYAWLGEPRGFDAAPRSAPPAAAQAPAMPDIGKMVERLAARLKEQPDNLQGWQMLGRSYRMLERPAEAAEAYGRAYELGRQAEAGVAAQTAVDYAEALALAAEGTLAGRPSELLSEVLKNDPAHPKALWMSGFAAAQNSDWAAAIGHWEKLAAQPDLDPDTVQTLADYLTEARAKLKP